MLMWHIAMLAPDEDPDESSGIKLDVWGDSGWDLIREALSGISRYHVNVEDVNVSDHVDEWLKEIEND